MDGIARIIIELLAGAVGGDVSGGYAKRLSLGTAGNSIAGGIGGVVLSQALGGLMGGSALVADPAASGLYVGALIGQVVGG